MNLHHHRRVSPCNGIPGTCPTDVDRDGDTGINDFLDLLAAWGPCK